MQKKFRKAGWFLIASFLLPVLLPAQIYTVETVPNTKQIDNSYVSNPDKLLSDHAVAQINMLLDSLERKTTAQVAVVMLNSIGDADVFDFAQSLFVKWGIGQKGKDNGLLILYVQDKRTVRFHTGFGVEGVLTDATCKRIQMEKMVPEFKLGNIDAGMIAGVLEAVRLLSDPSAVEANESATNITDEGAISFLAAGIWMVAGLVIFFVKLVQGRFSTSKKFKKEEPSTRMHPVNWLLLYYFLPLAILFYITYTSNDIIYYGAVYSYLNVLGVAKYVRMNRSARRWMKNGAYRAVYDFYQKNKAVQGLAILFPVPFVFLISHFRHRRQRARLHPRPCLKCRQIIPAPLSESTEDDYLTKESIFEESLKSVDYDVWKCAHCGDFHYEMYINPMTKFTQCPKCSTYALYTASSSTKVAATTSSTGIREIVKQCRYCNRKTIMEETIPMITTSSDSSSSSSGSSGGSWGGGDSGGGGASSSW
jgi:uncharacterized protein